MLVCTLFGISDLAKLALYFIDTLLLLTINVPVVYMGRYEVVLRGDYP
jgi:hypothetical protein